MEGQVAEEGGGAVCGWVVVEADVVGVSGAVGLVDDIADGVDPVRIIAWIESARSIRAVEERNTYLSPSPCQTTRGRCEDVSLWALTVASGCCVGEAVARLAQIESAKRL